jgi:hypothetical protein
LIHNSNARARAEAAFKKVQRPPESEKAKTEHDVEAQSVVEKTARLKMLRLAKEATNLGPPVKNKPTAASHKPVRG